MKILALLADRVQPAVTATRVRNNSLWPAIARLGHDVRILGLDLNRDVHSPAQGPAGLPVEFVRPRRKGFFYRVVGASTRSHHQWPPAPEFATAVDRTTADWRPDVVHAEELRMAAFLPCMRSVRSTEKQTLTLHNVESDLLRQTGSTRVPIAAGLFAKMQESSLLRFEKKAAHRVDLALAFSESDLARYQALYPNVKWGLTRNGTDVTGVDPIDPPDVQRVLLVGSLGYAPNVRGLEWFIDRVLPGIPSHIDLTVAGSGASTELKQRLAKTRVRFEDTPQTLTPLYASHGLCAIPLLHGSGTRGRILEALAHQRMVITTAKGAEGLGLTQSSGVVIKEDPTDFASAIVEWSMPSDQRSALAAQGRQSVMARYDWSVVAGEFVRALQTERA